MPSLFPGYEYDIFISYRQKDNKYDGWVTDFVENLKKELESTFKEDIGVYFDTDPHDGLLGTYDVDASLKNKIKCLVFIPVVSRTYCDENSFAWQHELLAFVNQSSKDPFGLKITLPDGNVASRVIPVRIHNLDQTDIRLCDSVLGGYLRGVEFIYSEPGVDRPLSPTDDVKTNLNRTRYRNQINKVALAIKGIISGLTNGNGSPQKTLDRESVNISTRIKDKSIIVLPFDNISAETDQEYFSDGLTEEIITDLSHIHDLIVISKRSAMTFKGSEKTIPEIAREVNVRYVLEGSVRKAGNQLRITVQLIDSENDSHLWAEKYSGVMDDIFDIQEKVSISIASQLKIKLSLEEKALVRERPVKDLKAFELYLKAKSEIYSGTEASQNKALTYLEMALSIEGDSPVLLAEMGHVVYQFWNFGIRVNEQDLKKAQEYVNKALFVDPESPDAHFVSALLDVTGGSAIKAISHLQKVIRNTPNHSNALGWLALIYSFLGMKQIAMTFSKKLAQVDPFFPFLNSIPVFCEIFTGNFEQAQIEAGQKEDEFGQLFKALAWVYNSRFREARALMKTLSPAFKAGYAFRIVELLALSGLKEEKKVLELMDDRFLLWASKDFQYSFEVAEVYANLGYIKDAIDWLEQSVNLGCLNYHFFNEQDPFLAVIRDEKRFKELMDRVFAERESLQAFFSINQGSAEL